MDGTKEYLTQKFNKKMIKYKAYVEYRETCKAVPNGPKQQSNNQMLSD